jgi:hypothetical protein
MPPTLDKHTLTRAHLKTPRAAAVAGLVFSVLLIAALWLLQSSIPSDPHESGAWIETGTGNVALALNLIPFAGIAFLWFIGVRDRLGLLEDRFFATVFFGSALLFLAMLFAGAAVIGAIFLVATVEPNALIGSTTFHVARSTVNVYAIKMAGVFMISTSTVALYTGFAPRWIAVLGYALALVLLLGSYYIGWSIVVLPAWVFLFSTYILIDNFRNGSSAPRAHMAYDDGGIKALKPKPNGGREHENMTLAEKRALLARFAKAAGAGEMLNIHDLKAAYEKAIGHATSDSTVYNLLHRHGWRKLMPRPFHPKRDLAAQSAIKKTAFLML